MGNEWIKHDGKGYPENLVGRFISKRYRDGQESRGELVADLCSDIVWRWDEKHSSHDIIEYKVVS